MACSQEDLLFLSGAIGMRLILWGALGARSPRSGIFVLPLCLRSLDFTGILRLWRLLGLWEIAR